MENSSRDLLVTTELGRKLIVFAEKHQLIGASDLVPAPYLVDGAVALTRTIIARIFDHEKDAARAGKSVDWEMSLPFEGLAFTPHAEALLQERVQYGHFASADPVDIYKKANFDSAIANANVEAALFVQFQEQLGEEIWAYVAPKTALKLKGVEFVSHKDAEMDAHIARHNAASLTIGSKFLFNPAETAAFLNQSEIDLADALLSSANQTGSVKRVVLQQKFGKPAGTDVLIDLSKVAPQDVFQLVRDAGTPHEAVVNVVMVTQKAIPTTDEVTIIGGPYGASGKAGFYTVFPGDPGMPLLDTDYWKTHGFLATRNQVAHTLQQMEDQSNQVRAETVSQPALQSMIEEGGSRVEAFMQPAIFAVAPDATAELQQLPSKRVVRTLVAAMG